MEERNVAPEPNPSSICISELREKVSSSSSSSSSPPSPQRQAPTHQQQPQQQQQQSSLPLHKNADIVQHSTTSSNQFQSSTKTMESMNGTMGGGAAETSTLLPPPPPPPPRLPPNQQPEQQHVRMEECDYDKTPTLLYKAIERKDWDEVVQLFEKAEEEGEEESQDGDEEDDDNDDDNDDDDETRRKNRKKSRSVIQEASVWVVRKEPDGRLRWRLLPLHAAVIFNAPPPVVDALIRVFPLGATLKDDQGMLPLHLACRNAPPNFPVLEELLTAHPAAVYVKDRKGRTPILGGLAATGLEKNPALSVMELYTRIAAAGEKQRWRTEQEQVTEQKVRLIRVEYETQITELKRNMEQQLSIQLERHNETTRALASQLKATRIQLDFTKREHEKTMRQRRRREQKEQQKEQERQAAMMMAAKEEAVAAALQLQQQQQEQQQSVGTTTPKRTIIAEAAATATTTTTTPHLDTEDWLLLQNENHQLRAMIRVLLDQQSSLKESLKSLQVDQEKWHDQRSDIMRQYCTVNEQAAATSQAHATIWQEELSTTEQQIQKALTCMGVGEKTNDNNDAVSSLSQVNDESTQQVPQPPPATTTTTFFKNNGENYKAPAIATSTTVVAAAATTTTTTPTRTTQKEGKKVWSREKDTTLDTRNELASPSNSMATDVDGLDDTYTTKLDPQQPFIHQADLDQRTIPEKKEQQEEEDNSSEKKKKNNSKKNTNDDGVRGSVEDLASEGVVGDWSIKKQDQFRYSYFWPRNRNNNHSPLKQAQKQQQQQEEEPQQQPKHKKPTAQSSSSPQTPSQQKQQHRQQQPPTVPTQPPKQQRLRSEPQHKQQQQPPPRESPISPQQTPESNHNSSPVTTNYLHIEQVTSDEYELSVDMTELRNSTSMVVSSSTSEEDVVTMSPSYAYPIFSETFTMEMQEEVGKCLDDDDDEKKWEEVVNGGGGSSSSGRTTTKTKTIRPPDLASSLSFFTSLEPISPNTTTTTTVEETTTASTIMAPTNAATTTTTTTTAHPTSLSSYRNPAAAAIVLSQHGAEVLLPFKKK